MNANDAINLLNEIFKNDSTAMWSLMCTKVPANQQLVNHPKIICDLQPVIKSYTLGVLGILNTLFAPEIIEVTFSEGDANGKNHIMTGFRLKPK